MDASPPPPPTTAASLGSSRTVADLDADSLAHCAGFLGIRDLAHMAISCRLFRQAAYSDSIWRRLFRESWPHHFMSSELSDAREAYLSRQMAVQQFKFDDPLKFNIPAHACPHSHIILNRNDIIFSQGSQILKIDTSRNEAATCETLRAHNARITCMRLFPLSDTSLFRNEAQKDENVLVTSSSDHTIRLWWKGRSQRCFKGHNSPVTTMADRLLGNSSMKILASGGEDGSVRLWSFSSSGKRHPLVTTFHGHEKPVSFLSVAGHNASLLVSISKDAKIRVWDASHATVSSASRSSSCVGMTSVCGQPVDMTCHENLCYIAAGSSVTAIDLRTMRKVSTAASHLPKLYSFAMLASKSIICTGGNEKAMLWDVRKNAEKTEPLADLDGHVGCVAMLHIDPYKVVTGGPDDFYVKIWETDTGAPANSLGCCSPHQQDADVGLSAMAVDGSRIVTGSYGYEPELIYFRDFSNSFIPLSDHERNLSFKFWEPLSSPDD
uniref:F-box/WD repeat-containing protein sel-10 n=1 Tax=Anthurium amnicola TaxID=1678845 RepID=A0A1D1YXI1_9ARAE